MRPSSVVFQAPASAQLERWAGQDPNRAERLRRIAIHKLKHDGDLDAVTGPRFGRVHSLLSTPTIGNGEYMRILWEIVGDAAHIWALSVERDALDGDDDSPPD
jgi:hypothetical protein